MHLGSCFLDSVFLQARVSCLVVCLVMLCGRGLESTGKGLCGRESDVINSVLPNCCWFSFPGEEQSKEALQDVEDENQ